MDSRRIKKTSLHACFWLLYYLVFVFIEADYDHQYGRVFISNAIELTIQLSFTYLVLLLYIPKFLNRGYTLKFWFYTGMQLLLSAILLRAAIGLLIVPYLFPDRTYVFFDLIRFTTGATYIAFPAAIIISIEMIISNYQRQLNEKLLLEEKSNMELNFLKSQMSPHFLFNTLNNIYGLTLDESPTSARIMLQLSELLRSILHHVTLKFISLEEETEMIKSYLELEKIRYDNRLDLTLELNLAIKEQPISPLILLTLVENAFKHGVSESVTKPYIHIKLIANKNEIVFSITNSYNPKSLKGEGTGLKNLTRQLELLYPNQYTFICEPQTPYYRTELSIQLTQT